MTSTDFADFRIFSKFPSGSKKNFTNFDSSGGITRYRFALGEVLAWNVELDINVPMGCTRITLREIPRFLVSAFDMIIENGLHLDGIFRKEGNSARLNRPDIHEVYRGLKPIPTDFTIHDVCTMIKRFLRDLSPTLLDSPEIRQNLLGFAVKAIETDDYEIEHEVMWELLYGTENQLSPSHIGTLAYIMRFLFKISQHSNTHKMTPDNLAVVLVASVFGDFMPFCPSTEPRKKGTKRCTAAELQATRVDMEIQVAAVKMLIVNAKWIALPKSHYVSSTNAQGFPHVRSTSAMPHIRCGSTSSEIVQSGQSSSSTNMFSVARAAIMQSRSSLVRRDSDIAHIKEKKSSKRHRRSASFLPLPSSLRGFRERVSSQFLKRTKSPSSERTTPVPPLTPKSTCTGFSGTDVFADDFDLPKSPSTKPIEKIRTRNAPSTSESHRGSIGSTSSVRYSRSVQARRGTTNSAVARSALSNDSSNSVRMSIVATTEKKSISASSSTQSTLTNRSLRRVSNSEQNTLEQLRHLKRRESEEDNISAGSVNTIKKSVGESTPPSTRKKKRVEALMKSKGISRRNTTDGSMLKPKNNKIGIEKQRRATCWDVHPIPEEEKENNLRISTGKHNCDVEDSEVMEETKLDETPSILEQMDTQARIRRIGGRQARKMINKKNSESMMVLNGSMAVFDTVGTPKSENVRWRGGEDNEREMLRSRRKQLIDEKNLLKTPVEEREEEELKNEHSLIISPRKSRSQKPPSMDSYLEAASSSSPSKRVIDSTSTPKRMSRPMSGVLHLKQLDSLAIQNGSAWVGEKTTVFESPQPPRRSSMIVAQRAMSAAPTFETNRRSPSPKCVLKPSPVLRRAMDSQQRFVNAKTYSPLITRSKSHLCKEMLSNEYGVLATPPRTPRAVSPTRPTSNLIFSTPNMQRKALTPMVGLSTSSRPTLRSTSSLATPICKPVFNFATTSSLNEEEEEEGCSSSSRQKEFKCPVLPPMKSHDKMHADNKRKAKSTDDSNASENLNDKELMRHVSSSAVEDSQRFPSVFDSSDNEFGFGKFNDIIRTASEEMSLPAHKTLEARLSVAMLRNRNSGKVHSIVQGIEQKSRVSMDITGGRTSGYSQSSMRSTETISSNEQN